MGEFAYTLEKYNGPATRHTCPRCLRKREFARYVDVDGNYLHDDVGRCNRESGCGYHMKPKEYFESIGGHVRPACPPREAKPVVNVPVRYISADTLKATLKGYERNTFVLHLRSIFDADTVQRLIDAYGLGTTRDGSCIFWQVDDQGRVRTGKVIRYKEDGHRDKSIPPYFIHKRVNVEPVEQCLFGQHRLMADHDVIGLVESEKTAVIMAGQFPDVVWMATGGKTNLSKVHVLRGKKVVAFPDTDAHSQWVERLGPYGFRISNTLQKYVEDPDKGYDLADFVTSPPLTISDKPYLETLKDGRVIEMHPAGFPLSWAV